MKKILLLALVALMGTAAVSAQPQGERRGPMPVSERVAQLKEKLSLTDEQATQVTDILNDFRAKAQERRSNRSPQSRDDMRQQMRADRDSMQKRIDAVLTDEQKETYKKLQAEERKRFGNGPRRGR